ncbi:uncharacterized protein EV154DRAFT_557363 [Mucor mucedo]|uniref:uncharacterized protein n=1 Tax=Mucor mucedo TaxID=29922 RepID=UPI00222112F6|nr:uncharacterized protein EV154DRAFT_557363 [Mucor mucedo]KAI7864155.1 hypothetical protein EV154DRAFT_557363 [Mucor mucedo]
MSCQILVAYVCRSVYGIAMIFSQASMTPKERECHEPRTLHFAPDHESPTIRMFWNLMLRFNNASVQNLPGPSKTIHATNLRFQEISNHDSFPSISDAKQLVIMTHGFRPPTFLTESISDANIFRSDIVWKDRCFNLVTHILIMPDNKDFSLCFEIFKRRGN